MTMLVSIAALVAAPVQRLLVALPRPVWYALAAAALLLAGRHWYAARLAEARSEGARQQAAADRQIFDAATVAATGRQRDLVAKLQTRQAEITKGSNDALLVRNHDLSDRYHDLRLRWAAWQAAGGGAGAGAATAVSGAAGSAGDTACPAAGWVAFDTAAAAAEAADIAIARDDAWRAWAAAQAAAWPVD
jgi:hypothetical protein